MRTLFASFLFLLTLVGIASAQSSPAKLEGQIVCCEECWVRADRKTVPYGTAEDLLKAVSCVENGDPTLLAVEAGGRTTFYQLEDGRFKRPGANWLEFVGRRVEINGPVRARKDTRYIKVDALKVLAPSLAEQESAKVVGSEVDLTLKDLFGVEQKLSSYKGRIVVLNFWATYCVPCRTEMPDLASVQNEYAALGVQVVGASADAAEDRPKVLQFIKETKINFPVWTGATSADMLRFGLGAALPGTVIIGRDGKVVSHIRGVIKPAELRKQIEALLSAAEAASNQEGGQKRVQAASVKPKPGEASSVPS